MFSSLPSASKIYVSSSKPKQKNLNSAKKKRKKVAVNTCTPVRAYDEETLVSSISLRKGSASELSMNSSNEESIEIELKSKIGEVINISEEIINEENANGIENHNFENKLVDSVDETKTSLSLISCKETKLAEEMIEHQNLANIISDSIYSEECTKTDSDETAEYVVESSETILKISTPSIEIKNGECDEKASSVLDNTNVSVETGTSSLPLTLLITEDSGIETLEDDQLASKDLVCNSPKEMCSKVNEYVAENNENEVSEFYQVESNFLFPTSGNANLDHQKNEVFFETSCAVLCESKDAFGEKMLSDVDSSSGQSDCCAATNIFDIHVDNSEHGSVDENQTSNGENCRMQSPEQSEVSCTESIMYDAKSGCHNGSQFQNCSILEEKLCQEHIFPNSSHKGISDINNLPEIGLDSSNSFTDLQKVKSNIILRRSFSLPELLSHNIYKRALVTHSRNFDNFISKSSNASDKSTFTIDTSSIDTSDKCTLTSDIINSFHCKKDAATTPVKNESEIFLTENEHASMSALKNSSMLLMNVLPPVAIMQARARSYVFGSVGATRSLLGNEELSRFFPESKVTIFVGTWNMNGHDPPACIDDFILPLDVSSVPDIYAVGVQESMQSRSDWEILLQTTLGPSHVLFAATSFGVLHLSIFMRRDLIWFCSEPEDANIATRPGSMIKTKGAVAICFTFFGTSMLFVNSHLTAHEQKLKERLSDYEKICSALDLPKHMPLKSNQKGKDVTSRFDCVFWCGDLNFRVVQDRPSVLSFVEKFKNPERLSNLLIKHDQLTQAMAKGAAFHGFNEGMINFIPSYKFDVGTSCFDSAKQRVPSYTDRILYRSSDKSSVVCLHYDAVSEIFTSDHKPVFAVFKVSIKPGRDNIPLAAGLFKRDIYLEAIKRRAQQLEVSRNHKQSTICNVM